MDYELPDHKLKPLEALVISYKTLKHIEWNDRVWDRIHFGRCMKEAKTLLEICGDFNEADRCLVELVKKFEELSFYWNFSVIIKHAHDWRQLRQRETHDRRSSRQRLFDEIARRKTDLNSEGHRSQTAREQVSDVLRNTKDIEAPGLGYQDNPGSGEHEGNVDKLLPGAK